MTDLLADLKALVAKYDAAPAPDPQPVPTPDPQPDPVPTPDPQPVPAPDPVPAPTPTPVPTPAPLPKATVSTATELAAAIKAAQPGDKITLAGGLYGALPLTEKSGLTFAAADPANRPLFTTISLAGCKQMVLDGIMVSRPPQMSDTDNNVKAVLISACDGVIVTGSDIETQKAATGAFAGYPNGYSLHVSQSKNVSVLKNEIRGGHRAVMLTASDGVKVEDNHIHDFRAVGVGGGGNNRLTIRGNHMHDARPWNFPQSDHGDFIHLWDGRGKPAIIDTVIESNTLIQGTGVPIMGISVQNTQGSAFVNVRVADNLVITENNQALRFDGVQDIDVEGNTFLSPTPEVATSTGAGGKAMFVIGGAKTGRAVRNIWGGVSSSLPNCTVASNLTMKFAQQDTVLLNPKGSLRADFLARLNGPGAGLGIH